MMWTLINYDFVGLIPSPTTEKSLVCNVSTNFYSFIYCALFQ